jgi:hypothetical protein
MSNGSTTGRIELEHFMQGIVQYTNTARRSGILKAQDGETYAYRLSALMTDPQPRVGDAIEFSHDGEMVLVEAINPAGPKMIAAPEPFQVAPRAEAQSAPIGFSLSALRESLMQGKTEPRRTEQKPSQSPRRAPAPAAAPSRNPMLGVMGDWRNVFAALALVACMLPFISFAMLSMNLFAAVSFAGSGIDTLKMALHEVQQLQTSAALVPWGGAQGAARVASPSAADLAVASQVATQIWMLRLSYLLLTIPLMSALTLGAAFTGRDSSRPAFWLGVLCLMLPVVAVVGEFALSSLRTQMPMGMGALVPGVMGMLGMGFYLLTAIGVGLMLVHRGIIRKELPITYAAA